MQYSVVIVEDERHQQESLIRMLEEDCRDLRIVGIADSIDDACTVIKEKKPDLVFLDVMLPPYTSFDLLNRIASVSFDIIFTTSFEEFAVKAFRLSAVDYLVKPLVRHELSDAVEKFRMRQRAQISSEHLSVLMRNFQSSREHKKIALPSLTGYVFVVIDDIVRCESDNTYTTFYLLDKRKIIVSKTLKDCESLLQDFSFFRVHNSNLINLDHIVEYERGEGGVVRMIDGSAVDVSRRRKDDFLRSVKKLSTEKY